MDAASSTTGFFRQSKAARPFISLEPSSISAREAVVIKCASYAIFIVAFLVTLYLRRSDQFRHPQVWDEDGTVLLPDFINHGWIALIRPVNGYLVLIPKLICLISLHLSFFYFSNISTVLAWLFIAGVCCAVAFCPTWLRGRELLGFCAILIPSNPECMGVPLYTFWWASLLLFLVVLWENESRDLILRSAFLLLAGLSTPVIVLIPPLMALRVILLKHRGRNSFLLGVTLFCVILQFFALRSCPGGQARTPDFQDLLAVIPCFFGTYPVGNFFDNEIARWILGSVVLVFILVGMRWDLKKPLFPFLLYLCFTSIFMAALRNPLGILRAGGAGPRYFFFPYILISWMIVNVGATRKSLSFKIGAGVLLLSALVNVLPVLNRTHTNLHWHDHIASAAHFDEYTIPVQFDGISEPWPMFIHGTQARALLASDLFATRHAVSETHPFPYSVVHINIMSLPVGARYATTADLDGPVQPMTMKASESLPPGFTVTGSCPHGDADRLTLTLHLHRGDNVLYCSGFNNSRQFVHILNEPVQFSFNLPIAEHWHSLDFSSDQLPAEFTATFCDQGTGAGEWFDIALKDPALP